MSSFLYSILCCCSRRRSLEESQEERTSLLPSPEDGPFMSPYDSTNVDHQKAKERLNVIVRAKEGRMVRVLSRVPFNLRNNPSNGLTNASSSRSNHSPSTNVDHANQPDANHYVDSEPSSPKYRLSPSVSRSESTSSVQQACNSRISIDDLSDAFAEHKLRVQLIPSAKSKKRALSRRGRSRVKNERYGHDADGDLPTLEGIQSVDSGREDLGKVGDPSVPVINEVADAPSVSSQDDRPRITPLSDEENADIKVLSKQLSPILKDDDLMDIGTLTRSWGD